MKPFSSPAKTQQLSELMTQIPIETGDIFFRASRIMRGFIPFGKIVMWLTNSNYSHAAIAIIENETLYLVEANDSGCIKTDFKTWLGTCKTEDFAIYRKLERDYGFTTRVILATTEFLQLNTSYDFSFGDDTKFYCTETIEWIYDKLGVTLDSGTTIKEMYSLITLNLLIRPLLFIYYLVTGYKISVDKKMYFVGNKKQGLMSSKLLGQVYKFNDPWFSVSPKSFKHL